MTYVTKCTPNVLIDGGAFNKINRDITRPEHSAI